MTEIATLSTDGDISTIVLDDGKVNVCSLETVSYTHLRAHET